MTPGFSSASTSGEDLGDDPPGVAHLLDLAAGLAGHHRQASTGSPSSEARMTSRPTSSMGCRPSTEARMPGLAVVVDDVVERRELLGQAGPNRRLLVVGAAGRAASRRGRRCPRPGAGSRAGCRRGRSRCRCGGSPSGRRRPRAAGRCRSPCRRAGRPPRARRRGPWPGRASAGSRRGSRRAARRAGRGGRGTRRRSSSRARAGPGSCSARRRGRGPSRRRPPRAAGRPTPAPARRDVRRGSAPGSPSPPRGFQEER